MSDHVGDRMDNVDNLWWHQEPCGLVAWQENKFKIPPSPIVVTIEL